MILILELKMERNERKWETSEVIFLESFEVLKLSAQGLNIQASFTYLLLD